MSNVCFGLPNKGGSGKFCPKIFGPPMQIVGPNPAQTFVGTNFGYTGAAANLSWFYGITGGIYGDAYTWEVIGATGFGAGLTFLPNGVITGTATTAGGPYPVTIRATNCEGCSVQETIIVTVQSN